MTIRCLSLWFRIFKTVITVLQAVMSGYSAIVCVVSVFASFSDEVQKQANAAAIPGFIAYNIVMSVLLAAVVPPLRHNVQTAFRTDAKILRFP